MFLSSVSSDVQHGHFVILIKRIDSKGIVHYILHIIIDTAFISMYIGTKMAILMNYINNEPKLSKPECMNLVLRKPSNSAILQNTLKFLRVTILIMFWDFFLPTLLGPTSSFIFGKTVFNVTNIQKFPPTRPSCLSFLRKTTSYMVIRNSRVNGIKVSFIWSYSNYGDYLAFNLSTPSLVHPGKSTWTEALIPVPKKIFFINIFSL